MKKTIAKIALASMVLSLGNNGLLAAPIDETNKNAWGENTGWINFAPDTGDVDVTSTGITGNAWGATTGWVNFNPSNGGVTNTCGGTLSGSAWAASTGWIDFSGVTIDSNGFFQGTATDATGGDILFSGDNFKLQTDWRPNCDFDTIVYQAPTQSDPTPDGTAVFRTVFTTAVDPSSFVASDITLTGSTGTVTSGPTEVSPNDGTTFEFTVTGMTETETVTATIAAGTVNAATGTPVNKASITDTTGIHDIFGDGSSVATYNFDGDATDLGGTYNGTATGGIVYSAGKYGNAASLDGVDDYIDLTAIPETITGSDWSYSINIKVNELDGSDSFLNGRNLSTTGINNIKNGQIRRVSQKLLMYSKGTDDVDQITTTTGNVITSIDEFYNLVYKKTGNLHEVYLNGEVLSVLSATSSGSTTLSQNVGFILGKHKLSNLENSFFDGNIDQFRVFNRSLSDSEIQILANEIPDNQVTYPDVTAPGVPVVSGISVDTGSSTSDYITSDNTQIISGTGEANSTVEVLINGISVGTTSVDANGDWTFDYTGITLADGNYDVTVKGSDANGNMSVESNIIDVEIDTIAPIDLTITSPESGESTNDTTPLVEGTGEPGAIVNVTSGSSSCTATVNASGIYSCELSPALTEGNHTISVTQTDTAGNVGTAVTTDIEVDTTFPNAPSVDTNLYNTDTPSITGEVNLATGETLSVIVDGEVYTQISPELTITGTTWTLSIPTVNALTDGTYNVDAIVSDSAGNATTDVSTSEVSIDTQAPDAPVVTSPTTGTTTNDTTPTFTGTGEPESVITVTDGNGHTCSDTVDASGNWSCNISGPLTDGTTATFTTTQTDIAGNESAGTDVELTIDTTAPTAPTVNNILTNSETPTITGMVELETGETLSVTVDGVTYEETDPALTVVGSTWTLIIPTGSEMTEGTYDVVATVTDAASNTTSDTGLNEVTLDLTAPIDPTIDGPTNGAPVTGKAEPHTTVVVTTPSGATCTTTADAAGDYSCVLSPTPVDGEDATVTSTDPAGNETSITEVGVIDIVAPLDPVIVSPTQGSPVIGTAEPNTTITLTTPSGSSCTTEVDANGDFSCDLEPDPIDGETITSTIVDAANNTRTSIAPNAIDLTPPGVPVVSSISIDTGSSSSDYITSDNTQIISGTAEENSTVEVFINGISVGTTSVDASGEWTYDYTATTLADGNYDVTVKGVDASGNASVQSNIIDIEIDTTAPNAVTINSPTSGEATNDTTPLVEGTGEPGAIVTVTSGSSSCTATVNASGIYSCELSPALTEGNHTISVVQTDTAGNESEPVTTDIEVDTTMPTPATVNLGVVNTSTPDITGTATIETGDTFSVIVDEVVYTLGDGNLTLIGDTWTLSIPSANPLDDGDYEVEAIITDAAGNSVGDISLSEIHVDTIAPATPVVTGPINGTTTNDTTPMFTGTGEPGAVVNVTDENGHTCSDTVDESGNWSCNISGPLTDGTTATFTTTQTDIAGNTSDAIDTEITIDTTAPTAPTINNILTNSTTPTITGMVELNDGEALSVTVDGVTYEETDTALTVTGSTWELIIPGTDAINDGRYDVIATVTDAASNATTDNSLEELTIDSTPPATPTLVHPTNGSPVIGTAEPESIVVITTPSGSTCTTTADVTGNYQCVLVGKPVDGEDVTVVSTDEAGNSSEETIPSGIDITAPVTPTLISPTQGAPVIGTAEPGTSVIISTPSGATCSTMADATGNFSCALSPTPIDGETVNVLSIDAAGNTSLLVTPNAIDISAPTSTTINAPTNGAPVTGTAEPGVTVNITTPSGATCTTTADVGGNYSCTLSPTPVHGEDAIITTTDSAGNYSSTVETAAIDIVIPVKPTISEPENRDKTNDNTPNIIGTAEAGSTVEIYIDGEKVGETLANAQGEFSYTSSELPDGNYEIQAQSIDTAGNESGLTLVIDITIDTQVPGVIDGSLNVEVDDTTAIITWETNEKSSSQILYGLTQTVDNDSGEFDIAPRVSSHSLTLNNLLSCTTYFYKTISEDESENILTAGIYNFTTEGCIAEANVEKLETTNVVPNTNGTNGSPLSIGANNNKLELNVPVGYNQTDTCEDGGAYFQMKEINKEQVVASVGVPEFDHTAVRTYDLSAYCNTGERVESFDEEIEITASYAGQGILEQNEEFTDIYTYNESDSQWEKLKNCSVDSSNKTVTCFTPHFSTFGIFAKPVYSTGGGNGFTGGNLQGKKDDNKEKITHESDVVVEEETSGIATVLEENEEELELSSALEEEPINAVIEDDSQNIEKETSVNGNNVGYTLHNDYGSCKIIDNLLDESYDDNHYVDLQDIENLSNRDFLVRLERAGVIDGDNHLFKGGTEITRVEFLKILMRSHCIEYRNEDTTHLDFVDLDNSTWEAKVVKKSIALGITTGDRNDEGEKVFRASDIISRAEAMKILTKMALIQSGDESDNSYTDITTAWHNRYVNQAEELGIINPEEEDYKFAPDSGSLRNDMMKLLHKLLKLYK